MSKELAPPLRIRPLSSHVRKSLISSLTFTCMQDVVLELVYNSLDAESLHVEIEVNFSQFQVTVKDNGQGINLEDLSLIGIPACTSKSIDSSFTRGFRGQALAALAHLGLIEITSKPVGSKVRASRILYQGTSHVTAEEDPYPPGTKVFCSDLFFNMPVRRAQWQAQPQLDKLKKILEKLAVVHPHVRFQLLNKHQHLELLHIYPTRSLKQSFLQVYSKKSTKLPITFEFKYLVTEDPQIWISGLRINQLSSRVEWLFVNGRYFNSPHLTKNVFEYLEKETSSEGFICHITCPHRLEANLEEFFDRQPKTFINSSLSNVLTSESKRRKVLTTSLQDVLLRVRSSSDLNEPLTKVQTIPETISRSYIIDPRTGNSRYVDPTPSLPRLSRSSSRFSFEDTPVYPTPPAPIPQPIFEHSMSLDKSMLNQMHVLGQISSKFILAIYERYIIVFDQHAADERILLEKFLASNWMEPTLVRCEIAVPHSLFYNEFGFQMTPCDATLEGDFYIRTVPSLLSSLPPKKWIQILEQLVNQEHDHDPSSIPKPFMNALCSKACRSAIMFGDTLSLETCQALVKALSQCQFPFQCAHGRPSVIPILSLPSSLPSRSRPFLGLRNFLFSS